MMTFDQVIAACPQFNQDHFDLLTEKPRRLIPFVGAGMSAPAYPLWNLLLCQIADEKGPSCASGSNAYRKEVDRLLAAGEYDKAAGFLRTKLGAGIFDREIARVFSAVPTGISDACRMLPELFIGPVVTTNFDRILEEVVYRDHGSDFRSVCVPRQKPDDVFVSRMTLEEGHYLLKLHGDVDNPKTRVLTEEDYNEVYRPNAAGEMPEFAKLLRTLFRQGRFLFLGCSLEQDRTLEVLQSVIEEGEHLHFAILELPECTVTGDPFAPCLTDPGTGDYWPAFQEKLTRLSDLHIHPIWYPHGHHEAVAVILRKLQDIRDGPHPGPDVREYRRHPWSFFGREKVVQDICSAMESNETPCLVHGPPGMGKTETCFEVLNRLDRAGWSCRDITLQGRSGYTGFFQELCRLAGGSQEETEEDALLELLRMKLTGRKEALYLDNFEDVLHADSPAPDQQVVRLLRRLSGLSGLAVLLSCREIITGMGTAVELAPLDIHSAEQLFRRVWNGPRLNDPCPELADFLEADLQRHPLSIVLMASQGHWTGTIAATREQWGAERSMVQVDTSDNPAHVSLEAALRSSFSILRDEAVCRRLWGIFSLVPGDLSAEQMEEMLEENRSGLDNALRLMRRLNLISRKGDGWYGMPPSIRQHIFAYASDPDDPEGSEDASVARLTGYYDGLLEQAGIRRNADNPHHLKAINSLDNILYFLDYLLRTNDTERLLILHRNMLNLYQFRSVVSSSLLERILAHPDIRDWSGRDRAGLREYLGDLKRQLGEVDAAMDLYRQAEELYRREQSMLGLANTLQRMGDLKNRLGEVDTAMDLYRQAEELYRREQDMLGLANTLRSMGELKDRMSELDAAMELYVQAEELYRREQDMLGLANTLRRIGDLKSRLGELDAAMDLYRQAEELFRREQDTLGLANTLRSMGELKDRMGEVDAAMDLYRQAEELYRREQDMLGLANTLRSMGNLKDQQGELDAAMDLYRQAEELFRREQDMLGLANTLQSMGDLDQRAEDYGKARNTYLQALPLYQREQEMMGYVYTLGELCKVYAYLGDSSQLLECIRELLPLLDGQPEQVAGYVVGCIRRAMELSGLEADDPEPAPV